MSQKLDQYTNTPFYGKSIGEIFYSTSSKTPPGAYPLWQGALISACDVILPQFWAEIQAMRVAGTIRTVTQATYDTEISTYGQTGAFVIDTTNKTVRLPKVTSFIQSLGDLSLVGTPVAAGLPNITGQLSWSDRMPVNLTVSGAFSNSGSGTSYYSNDLSLTKARFTDFSAEDSNAIYGNSSTVQPPAVRFPLYIQVYNCPVTASQAITDQLFSALTAKADSADVVGYRDLDYANQSEIAAFSTRYQATVSGAVYGLVTASAVGSYIVCHTYTSASGSSVMQTICSAVASGNGISVWMPIAKDNYYLLEVYNTSTTWYKNFIPFKGG